VREGWASGGSTLAAAIREHEAHARAGVAPSERDLALWSKLEEIERSIPVREQG
jgi:hypothetical protein